MKLWEIVEAEEMQVIFDGLDIPKAVSKILDDHMTRLPSVSKVKMVWKRLVNHFSYKRKLRLSKAQSLQRLLNELGETVDFCKTEGNLRFRCFLRKTMHDEFELLEGLKGDWVEEDGPSEVGWFLRSVKVIRVESDGFLIMLPPKD